MNPPIPFRSRIAGIWRCLKIGAVSLFVVWHLFFLIVRNPLDLWWDDYLKPRCERQEWWPSVEKPFNRVNNATYFYGSFFGVDQGWTMFVPEMARRAPFLAVRLEFTDDTDLLLLSQNEPVDLNHYFRVGGWRQRKIEDRLTSWTERTKLPESEELPLWEAYARCSVRCWHAQFPADKRTLARIVLLSRLIYFPKPGTDPTAFEAPTTVTIAVFGPDGKFRSKPEAE